MIEKSSRERRRRRRHHHQKPAAEFHPSLFSGRDVVLIPNYNRTRLELDQHSAGRKEKKKTPQIQPTRKIKKRHGGNRLSFCVNLTEEADVEVNECFH